MRRSIREAYSQNTQHKCGDWGNNLENTAFMIDHGGKRVNTKIHLPVAMYGMSIRIIITEDIAADCKQAEKLIDGLRRMRFYRIVENDSD